MTRKGLDVSHTDVSYRDVSGLKVLNMTDKGNMTKEDMTGPVILKEFYKVKRLKNLIKHKVKNLIEMFR